MEEKKKALDKLLSLDNTIKKVTLTPLQKFKAVARMAYELVRLRNYCRRKKEIIMKNKSTDFKRFFNLTKDIARSWIIEICNKPLMSLGVANNINSYY